MSSLSPKRHTIELTEGQAKLAESFLMAAVDQLVDQDNETDAMEVELLCTELRTLLRRLEEEKVLCKTRFGLPAFPGQYFRIVKGGEWRPLEKSEVTPEMVKSRMAVSQVQKDGQWLDFATVREGDLERFFNIF